MARESSDQNPPSKIAKFRKAVGLTQLELAETLDVTEATIANWESGRSGGAESIRHVVVLCEVLSCDLPDLLEQDLSELRRKAGLTQRSVSKALGIRENTFASWEKTWNAEGGGYKKVEQVARLCEALGRQPSELAPPTPPKKLKGASKHNPPTKKTLIQNLKRLPLDLPNQTSKAGGDGDLSPSSVPNK